MSSTSSAKDAAATPPSPLQVKLLPSSSLRSSVAMSLVTSASVPPLTPSRVLGPRAASPAPSASTMGLGELSEGDGESHGQKRNLLVKTSWIDGVSDFRSSDGRKERQTSVVALPESGAGLGWNEALDSFGRAPPMVKAPLAPDMIPDPNGHEGESSSRQTMPLAVLSSNEHDAYQHSTSSLDDDKTDDHS